MTGLQRRDIARLRREPKAEQNQRQPLAEIIALWWDDPDFDTANLPTQGEGASFVTLARRVRQDVHPRTFLDVLIENGAVEEDEEKVTLKTRSYLPKTGSEDQLAYLADNVADHLSTAVSNVLQTSSRFDAAVYYKGLSANAVSELDGLFRTRMKQTLEEMDTLARSLPETEDGSYRFRAGGYFFDDLDSVDKQNVP